MRAFVLLLALTGCRLFPPPAQARVQHGPAFGAQLTTIVAMPAVPAVCSPGQCGAVASASRIMLELAGYTIIDAELLNAETRRRTVTTHTWNESGTHRSYANYAQNPRAPSSDTSVSTRVEGETWQEAPPDQRAAIVREVGAEGVLQTTITSTPGPHQWITLHTVGFTLTGLDGRVVWHAECTDEEGDHKTERQALEGATRCALESLALW